MSGDIAAKDNGVDKSQKYDRQLRLWGDHGQQALESSHVCLINASSVGTEILKSLVLPGLGQFTVIDSNTVSGADAGCNFFLPPREIGQSRAETAVAYLTEMNEDVTGHFVTKPLTEVLETAGYFQSFSCVIATQLSETELVTVSEACWQSNVPLLIGHCCGLLAYARLQVAEHCVVEARPDNALADLRLDRPFPALIDFLNTQDLSTMSKKDHSHTPYVILLHKYLTEWKNKHGTAMPSNYKEKSEFKKMLRAGILVNEEGVPEVEENFDEALDKANACLCPTEVPREVQAILEDPCLETLSGTSSTFWVLVSALKRFVASEGCLPLRGTLPDMTADSERYIAVQRLYWTKAGEDAVSLLQYAHEICEEVGKDPLSITEGEAKVFCKNCAFLRVVRCRSFADEVQKPEDICQQIDDELGAENVHMPLYIMVRAALRFRDKYQRYPGACEGKDDLALFKDMVAELTKTWSLSAPLSETSMCDMVGYRGSELPAVTGFVGAVIAQEVIKILTRQFVPFNNTLLYSAVLANTATFQL